MIYIHIDQGRIQGIYSSSRLPNDGRNYREVPSWFAGRVGQAVAEFDEDWNIRPLEERLAAGLIPEAERYKAIDEELVPKSEAELIRDGIEPAPPGLKLDPDAPASEPRLIPMTREELVAAGQLSAEAAHRLDIADEERALLAELAASDWYATRLAETGVAIPAEVAAARQAARDRISEIRAELAEPFEALP